MLSYQHIYHAGNLADVHKHGMLAWILNYMIRKDKPLSYIETHGGRGLYDLNAYESLKTGEAAAGIAVAEEQGWFDIHHPYSVTLQKTRAAYGPDAYPGSPLVAAECLRTQDNLSIAELHPQEFAALDPLLAGRAIRVKKDGIDYARSITPPTPRRGVMLVDPPYEVKSEYDIVSDLLIQVHRKWNVGVLILWYPILTSGRHKMMIRKLEKAIPDGIIHDVTFPPARDGHRMIGSGLFVINAPFGFEDEAKRLSACYKKLK